MEITEENWIKAKKHFDIVRDAFVELRENQGLMVAIALPLFIEPLGRRFEAGERTQDLYDEMTELKV